ncbi:MAG: WecB/TagA/CpsF family glycosyltransferase [Firmicutes bacterium]|nr:WecB/TagA/CpsF family glycosyltransferase [Bacillota bacterium]
MKKKVSIMDVDIDKITLREANKKVEDFLIKEKPSVIYTPNTEIIMAADKDPFLKDILNDGDLTIADGIGLVYASRIKNKDLPERVTGYDLSMNILKIANEFGYSIFLLGGKEGIAKTAKKRIKEKYPNIKVVGVQNGYFKGTHIGFNDHKEERKIISDINKSKADILFVGLGAPKQEFWIHENKTKLNNKVIIGNGGTIDHLAGIVKRAPKIYQNLGIEWLYRLIKEPNRIKRQKVLPLFVLKVLFSKNIIR